ncbi:MAG: LPP20 family lipoprotein [Endomicrobiales bacterium]|nr:LPP20 family lipoprotein [Endomicrobiales bacterium]
MKKIFLALICTLVILSPLFAKTPDWVNGESKLYPKDKYIIGIGIGKNIDEARSAARAEIAKTFGATITQKTNDTIKEIGFSDENGKNVTIQLETQANTQVSTNQVLNGIEVQETWTNPKGGSIYALAVLEKVKMKAALSEELLGYENTLNFELEEANKPYGAVEKVRSYTRMLLAIKERNGVYAKMRVLGVAVNQDAQPQEAEILQKRSENCAKINFIIEADNENGLVDALKAVITKSEFSVNAATLPIESSVQAAEKVGYTLAVMSNISVKPANRSNPQWSFYDWDSVVDLYEDKPGGRLLSTITKSGQVSQLNKDAAKSRAIIAARDAASSALEEIITNYLFK